MSFRTGLAGLVIAGWLAGAADAQPSAPDPAEDMALGKASAPVTVIEYASMGNLPSARWDVEVFPAFKRKYIDTGKARFIFREIDDGAPDLAVAAPLLARCAGKRRYFKVIHRVFRETDQIFRSGNIRAGLVRAAASVGFTERRMLACVRDEAAIAAFQARAERNQAEAGTDRAPVFFFNGKRYGNGAMSMVEIDAAYAEAIAATPD